jgi:hypothetical protein
VRTEAQPSAGEAGDIVVWMKIERRECGEYNTISSHKRNDDQPNANRHCTAEMFDILWWGSLDRTEPVEIQTVLPPATPRDSTCGPNRLC